MSREIIFGIGGGIVCYQLGIAKFMVEHFSTEYLKENFVFGGASAGSITSLILCSVVHGVGTVDEWFNSFVLEIVQKISQSKTGALFKLNELIPETISKGYNLIINNTNYPTFLNNRFHISVTQLPTLEKKNITMIKTEEDLVQGLTASCYAPLLNKGFYYNYKDTICSDGVYCNKIPSRYENSQKVYFSLFNQKEQNCETINIYRWGSISLSDMWLWGDIDKSKKLFFKGYLDSKKYIHIFEKNILKNTLKINFFYEYLINKDTERKLSNIYKQNKDE